MNSIISTQNNDNATENVVKEAEDLISKLHCSILGHILSFLPTNEAVQTSLLSKRWIHVWKSTTGLQFYDSLYFLGKGLQKEQFVCFVNRVLLHLANSSIQSFSLCLTFDYDSSQISTWISSILKRGVQNLHIQYAHEVPFPSNSLLSCNSLVQLVLQMRCTLSLPIFTSLPNLQNLSISGIRLVSESSTCSEDLILRFPLLKVFEASDCQWLTRQNIIIQTPLLERFSIAIWRPLSNKSHKSAIKISAPRLTDFSYEGDLQQDIILLNSSSIRSASVVIVVDKDRNNINGNLGFKVHNLLAEIRDVEQLKLLFYQVLKHAKDIFTNLPAFGRLTCLELNEITAEALLKILHNSPILNTLVLQNGVSRVNKDVLSSVPQCFLSSLKVFLFKNFSGLHQDLRLAKFVIENSAVLEKMTISQAHWVKHLYIDMEKVKKKILSFPKCSNLVIIQFSNDSDS